MDELQEVVVAAAMVDEAASEEQQPVWPGGTQRLRRSSMTMAGAQVFEALHGDKPSEMNSVYPEVFANWVSSSAMDLPAEGDLLTDRGVPLKQWATWASRAAVVASTVACGIGAGVLGSQGRSGWRWLVWVGGTLFTTSMDWMVFRLVGGAVQSIFRTSQHVMYYLSGSRRPGGRLLSAVMSMCIFIGLFNPFDHTTTIVLNILICTVIAVAGLLVAHIATKVLAAHYHKNGFFQRLQRALQDEYYLMSLSKPRGKRMQRSSWTEQMYFNQSRTRPNKNAQKIGDARLALDDPKLLMSLEAVERHIHHNKLKLVFDKGSAVEDEGSAKRLAFYIFWNAMEDKQREHLSREDIAHFLPAKDVDGAFRMLDSDGDGKPSWPECRDAVIRIFKQRKQLTAALHDTGTIVGTLHLILVCLLQMVLVFLYLLVWHVDVARVWVTFSSIILAFTFIVGSSIRTAYENMIFLFIVHPFDVGDILMIEGESHVVHKMNLSNTVLEQASGIRVSYPNSKLAQLPICNQSRAECVRETYAFAMDLSTPDTTFPAVKRAVEEYISHHTKDFKGECTCVTTATLDPLKLRLSISVVYSFNHSESARLNEVRHGLILTATNSLVKKGVEYTEPQAAERKARPQASVRQAKEEEDEDSDSRSL